MLLHRKVDRRRVKNTSDWKLLEGQAHRFAAAFLLPEKSFVDELWAPTLDGMLARKERWKVSVAMMIVRCEHIGIVSSDQAKRLWINYNRRGWRGEEPLDNILKFEEPRLLRRGFEALVDENVRSKEQIIDDLCLPAREIEQLSALPAGYLSGSKAEVKAFPKLKAIETEPRLNLLMSFHFGIGRRLLNLLPTRVGGLRGNFLPSLSRHPGRTRLPAHTP